MYKIIISYIIVELTYCSVLDINELCLRHSALKYHNSHVILVRRYLTIRLRARDFYAVIVDEGEARARFVA